MELTPLAQLIRSRGGSLRAPAAKTFPDFSVPAEYERFLIQHDGTDGMDDAGWCFWGRAELRRIADAPDITAEHPIPPECDEPRDYILFADHLMHAGFLCFRIHRPSSETPVFYFFGFGALLPLSREWDDLHYAMEHEAHSAPFFETLHQRCLARQSPQPLPPPSILQPEEPSDHSRPNF